MRLLMPRLWVIYGDICDQYGFSEAANVAWGGAGAFGEGGDS